MTLSITDKGRWWILPNRQKDVFEGLAEGKTVKELANEFGCSIKAVEDARMRVYQKMGCRSPVDLCRMAMRIGLIEP